MKKLLAVLSIGVVVGGSAPAIAAVYTDSFVGFSNNNGPGSTFTRTIAVDPVTGTDGLFMLSAFGDFNATSESVSVSIEGLDLGTFLDGNPGNDLFDRPFADTGNQYKTTLTGSAVIPLLNLATIISDGSFVITYMLGWGVDNLSYTTEEFLTASITDVAPVPIPAALPLFGTGIAAMGLFGWWRRRNPATAAPR